MVHFEFCDPVDRSRSLRVDASTFFDSSSRSLAIYFYVNSSSARSFSSASASLVWHLRASSDSDEILSTAPQSPVVAEEGKWVFSFPKSGDYPSPWAATLNVGECADWLKALPESSTKLELGGLLDSQSSSKGGHSRKSLSGFPSMPEMRERPTPQALSGFLTVDQNPGLTSQSSSTLNLKRPALSQPAAISVALLPSEENEDVSSLRREGVPSISRSSSRRKPPCLEPGSSGKRPSSMGTHPHSVPNLQNSTSSTSQRNDSPSVPRTTSHLLPLQSRGPRTNESSAASLQSLLAPSTQRIRVEDTRPPSVGGGSQYSSSSHRGDRTHGYPSSGSWGAYLQHSRHLMELYPRTPSPGPTPGQSASQLYPSGGAGPVLQHIVGSNNYLVPGMVPTYPSSALYVGGWSGVTARGPPAYGPPGYDLSPPPQLAQSPTFQGQTMSSSMYTAFSGPPSPTQPNLFENFSSETGQSLHTSSISRNPPRPNSVATRVGEKRDEASASLLRALRQNPNSVSLSSVLEQGAVKAFCRDQNGSRWLQAEVQRLGCSKPEGSSEEGEDLLVSLGRAVEDDIRALAVDPFSNYVLQKLLTFGTEKVQRGLVEALVATPTRRRMGSSSTQTGGKWNTKSSNAKDPGSFFEKGGKKKEVPFFDAFDGEDFVFQLCFHPFGCRVVQAALETVDSVDTKLLLARGIKGGVEEDDPKLGEKLRELVQDSNSNHVLQKLIEKLPSKYSDFVADALGSDVKQLARHGYGCRVLQRLLECGSDKSQSMVVDRLISPDCSQLVPDKYGNYLAQVLLERRDSRAEGMILETVLRNLERYCCDKFASQVVEKLCEGCVSTESRGKLLRAMVRFEGENREIDDDTTLDYSRPCVLSALLRDRYGNFIVQKILRLSVELTSENVSSSSEEERRSKDRVFGVLKANLPILAGQVYGRHVLFALLEKGYMTEQEIRPVLGEELWMKRGKIGEGFWAKGRSEKSTLEKAGGHLQSFGGDPKSGTSFKGSSYGKSSSVWGLGSHQGKSVSTTGKDRGKGKGGKK